MNSFDQKAAAQWAIIRAHPNTSATAIYKRYKGTPMGMRKQDSLSLTKQLKDADELVRRNEKAEMGSKTAQKLRKGGYKAAKEQSIGGKRRHRPKDGEKEPRTIRKTISQLYGTVPIEEQMEYFGGSA